jgi:hypothetical protein
MAEYMKNIKKYLTDIIINHDKTISAEDKIALKADNNLCVFDFLSSKNTLDNELIIRLLIKTYNIDHINSDTLNIKAVNYQNLMSVNWVGEIPRLQAKTSV